MRIESNKGRASWVHVDNCKIVPRGVTEHFIPEDSMPRRCDGGNQPERRETCYREGATDELEVEEDQRLRSIRSKKRPKRYESD